MTEGQSIFLQSVHDNFIMEIKQRLEYNKEKEDSLTIWKQSFKGNEISPTDICDQFIKNECFKRAKKLIR